MRFFCKKHYGFDCILGGKLKMEYKLLENLAKTEEIFDEADLVRFIFPTLKEALATEPEADFFFNDKLRSGKEWLGCLSEEDLNKKVRISLIFSISTETDIYECNLLKEEN